VLHEWLFMLVVLLMLLLLLLLLMLMLLLLMLMLLLMLRPLAFEREERHETSMRWQLSFGG
jgi:hypothetical protein